jgi:CHAD domain-containing protein
MKPGYVKLKDIKPAIIGYVREAELLYGTTEFPGDKAIHDVRVLMKKARSVLRLINKQIDQESSGREEKALREVGRIARSWRETSVMRKTLKELKKSYPDLFTRLADNEKLNTILKKPDALQQHSLMEEKALDEAKVILRKSVYRIRFVQMTNLDPRLLLAELETTYNRAANMYLISRNYKKTSNLHELRKVSKDFLYQLWFFRPLNTSVIKSLEKKLDSFTRDLGKFNDLAQLLKELDYKYEYTAKPPAVDELAVIIRDEQDRLLARVWPLAHKIFCPGQNLTNLLGFKVLMI